MAEQKILIAGPVGQLEAIIQEPPAPAKKIFCVICHPHPLHGGTMSNKVVTTIARAMELAGVTSIRFNYRSVGQSAGEYANAIGESEDLQAVIEWGWQHYPNFTLWLAGFSFGSYVATNITHQRQDVKKLITIAPAVNHYDFNLLTDIHCPWLTVAGEEDEIVPSTQVQQWAANIPHMQFILLSGVGHFFHGHLIELRERILQWVLE